MDGLVYEIAEWLEGKGFKDVEAFVNMEGDRVATFKHDNDKWLLSIEMIETEGE